MNETQLNRKEKFEVKSSEVTLERHRRRRTSTREWTAVPDVRRGGKECTVDMLTITWLVQGVFRSARAEQRKEIRSQTC